MDSRLPGLPPIQVTVALVGSCDGKLATPRNVTETFDIDYGLAWVRVVGRAEADSVHSALEGWVRRSRCSRERGSGARPG